MKLTIEINLDNAAFHKNPNELGTMLASAVFKLGQNRDEYLETEEGFHSQISEQELTLRDSFGNTVGKAKVTQ